MRHEETFIDPHAIVEHRQHRRELPTETALMQFIKEHDAAPGWEGLKEMWSQERERGILRFFEAETVRALRENDDQALETARAFINYLDERLIYPERQRQTNSLITEKARMIRDYVVRVTNDHDLGRELALEFDNDLLNINSGGVIEPLLRRIETFIVDCSQKINDVRDQNELWRLQLNARAIRNELLRRLFENPET